MFKSSNRKIDPKWISLACNQASYIHRHEKVVETIVGKAISELSITSIRQSKRQYKEAKDRKRINLERVHLLQYLVFKNSEPQEITEELSAPDSISEEDMIIRYLALIVRKAMKRNSLYAITGVCRCICNYEFKDVLKIHESLLDGTDTSKDGTEPFKDAGEFRRLKKSMFEMIAKRFPKHLQLEETENGKEKHFILRKDQNNPSLIQLIKRSLDSFKPWYTECLSAAFMPHEEKHNIFSQQDESDIREIKRLHALIHLDCLSTLTHALCVDAPDTRLGIPQFFFVNQTPLGKVGRNPSGQYGTGGDDRVNTSSHDHLLKIVKERLAAQDERLKKFTPEGVLTVTIDGREVTNFNLDITNRVEFTVDDEEAERLEVIAQSEQLVLAIHLLDDEVWQSQNRECFYTVQHENGAKITFTFRPVTNADTSDTELLVTLTYVETSLRRSMALAGRRLRFSFSNWNQVEKLSPVIQQIIENNSLRIKQIWARKPAWIKVNATLLIIMTALLYVATFKVEQTPTIDLPKIIREATQSSDLYKYHQVQKPL